MYAPLVSVVVVTYNSAAYIIETLESIKEQTYKNIELIISDDNSPDNTVEVCSNWLERNNSRFVRVKIITSAVNTGITENFNRGILAANGQWIKTIAGDDALLPYTITKYIEFIDANPDTEVLHANTDVYLDTFGIENKQRAVDRAKYKFNKKELSAALQFEILLRANPIATCTVMFNRSIFDKFGLFNKEYPMWEDRPMWLKITGNNVRFQYLDIIAAKYRVRSSSAARLRSDTAFVSNSLKQRSHLLYKNYLNHFSLNEKIILSMLYNNIQFLDNVNSKASYKLRLFLYKLLILPLVFLASRMERKYS